LAELIRGKPVWIERSGRKDVYRRTLASLRDWRAGQRQRRHASLFVKNWCPTSRVQMPRKSGGSELHSRSPSVRSHLGARIKLRTPFQLWPHGKALFEGFVTKSG
jgi:hypothetical protein